MGIDSQSIQLCNPDGQLISETHIRHEMVPTANVLQNNFMLS